jgi:uncharacterized membrane protein YkvA (DUF1232 family)
MLARLKQWAASLKREIAVLWFACRDPRTPWPVKGLAVLIVAYALSPIDLIPDFIPVLGYLDELILLPAALWLVLRLLPPAIHADARRRADQWVADGQRIPRSALGLGIVVVLWLLLLWALWWAWSASG